MKLPRVPVLLLLVGCLLPGPDPPPLPAPELTVSVDAGSLGGGASQPPLALWSQPAAQASRDQVAHQLSLLCLGQLPATTPFAQHFSALVLAVLPASTGDPDPRLARYALLVRHSDAEAFAKGFGQGPGITAGEYAGRINVQEHRFVGVNQDVLAIGDSDLINRAAPQLPAAQSVHAPLEASFDFAPVFTVLRQLEGVGISYNLDPLLPRWRQQAPQLTLSAAAGQKGWSGTLHLASPSLPLHALAPALRSLCAPGHQLRLALGIEPRVVTQLIDNALALADERQLEIKLGMPLEEAGRCFTGDVVLVADAKGILPQVGLVLGLKPEGAGKLLAGHLAGIWNGAQLPAGADASVHWSLTTPIGPCQLALFPGRLVIANDPGLVDTLGVDPAAAHAQAGPDAVPEGCCAFVDCDLPSLAGQWLPVLWPLLSDGHVNLARDPLAVIVHELPEAASALLQGKGPKARLADLLANPPPVLMLGQGSRTVQWSPPPQLVVALRQLLGSQPPAQLDQVLCAFTDPRLRPLTVTAVFLREGDGVHALVHDQRIRQRPLTADELSSRCDGLDRALGQAPSALQAITPPEVPHLDRSWLPDAPGLWPARSCATAWRSGATIAAPRSARAGSRSRWARRWVPRSTSRWCSSR